MLDLQISLTAVQLTLKRNTQTFNKHTSDLITAFLFYFFQSEQPTDFNGRFAWVEMTPSVYSRHDEGI